MAVIKKIVNPGSLSNFFNNNASYFTTKIVSCGFPVRTYILHKDTEECIGKILFSARGYDFVIVIWDNVFNEYIDMIEIDVAMYEKAWEDYGERPPKILIDRARTEQEGN